MKHLFSFFFFVILLGAPACLKAQNSNAVKDSVILEVTDTEGKVSVVKLAWPYEGPPPVGSEKALLRQLTSTLENCGVDCPPKRLKISGSIWMCGDGSTIKTNDRRMGHLLEAAWGE